ncbi:RHS repeat-associated core domain-containing protein [Frankia sp. Mgl5]|uniref:RHS repeat-associated core domain-containing protein n=1 Tax=Frankia sp. Mgl5 TaxID=2933793 RepID=UPI0034D5A247
MGVRLYDPNLGRFLSTDPVPGGSDNPYDYAHQDPRNVLDPGGSGPGEKAWPVTGLPRGMPGPRLGEAGRGCDPR